MHAPAAHSDGDSFVFFRRADVVATGDIVDLRRFPEIDAAKGGSIQGGDRGPCHSFPSGMILGVRRRPKLRDDEA
jgi:hypothetical protein